MDQSKQEVPASVPLPPPEGPEPVPVEALTLQTANTVAELMDFEELYSPLAGRWAFRGQPRDYRKLTPSFQRVFPRRLSPSAPRN